MQYNPLPPSLNLKERAKEEKPAFRQLADSPCEKERSFVSHVSGTKIIKWLAVTVGATVFATIAINATDNLGNLSGSLIGNFVFSEKKNSSCPDDMVYVSTSSGGFCVDKYENSAWLNCPHANPANKQETEANMSAVGCKPISVKDVSPWTNIARHQAEIACARAGKRLPTSNEWYHAALGTSDKNSGWGSDDCNVASNEKGGADKTGSRALCVSLAGAYDMIGNVWEWTEETVYEGEYKNRPLPDSGFIQDVDSEGMALETIADTLSGPNDGFFQDYFWLDRRAARGVFRGGFWGSRSDAGQYAVNVTVPPSFIGAGVGFRCVKEAGTRGAN